MKLNGNPAGICFNDLFAVIMYRFHKKFDKW